MVEEHRRVEARQIVGTGMATDPERIDRVRHDAERRERDTRAQPAEGFGDVLGRAPARAELADEAPPRPRPGEPTEPTGPANSTTTTSKAQPPDGPPKRAPERTTPRAPDPRAKLLHAQLAQRAHSPPLKPASSTVDDATPPTLPAQRTPRS